MDHCDGDRAEKAHVGDRFSPDAAVPVKAVDKALGGQRLQFSISLKQVNLLQ
jgi:hypothetical protein